MPTYGPQIQAPRLTRVDPKLELLAQNIGNKQARHDTTMNQYHAGVQSILDEDSLHPEEKNTRLNRLRDNVFGNIQNFNGDVAAARDSILNTITEERKDPFYTLDRQYTKAFQDAKAQREALERQGKSVFLRGSDGREIEQMPGIFNEQGQLYRQPDLGFSYEGVQDYNAAAEKMFDNVQANISTLDPKEIPSQGQLRDLIAGYFKTGTVKSPNSNLNRVLQQSLQAYQQTPEYDQMRRRGIEGQAPALLNRAAEERKYYQEVEKYNPIKQPASKAGSDASRVIGTTYGVTNRPVVGTEDEARTVNRRLEKEQDKFDFNVFTGIYDNPEFKIEDGKLKTPTFNTAEGENELPLMHSRAMSELPKYKGQTERMRTILENNGINLGDIYGISDSTTELNRRINSKYKDDPESAKYLRDVLKDLNTYQELVTDIEDNEGNFKQAEAEFLDQYSSISNKLIESGVANDVQDVYKVVTENDINKSIQNKLGVYYKNDNEIDFGVDQFKTLAKDVLKVDKGDMEKVMDDPDYMEELFASETKLELTGDNINSAVTKGSNRVQFLPASQSLLLNDEYVIPRQALVNNYAELAPVLEDMSNINNLFSLSDEDFGKENRLNTGVRIPYNDDYDRVIPAGSTYTNTYKQTSNGLQAVVQIQEPDGETYEYPTSQFVDLASKSHTKTWMDKFQPDYVKGEKYKKIKDSKKIERDTPLI